ncbi:MAG: fibronectin type III domain-containing protein, partial [Ignavibacteria bacterium]|nr:fibronectin type III domain-containing protein [Ignavibacteria bacterium]
MNNNFLFLSPRRVFILLTSYFLLCNWSCKEYANNNPADPDYTLKPVKNLRITSFSDAAVTLQWTDINHSPTYPNTKVSFDVEHSNDGVNFTEDTTVGNNAETVTLNGTYITNTTYKYRVRAKFDTRVSSYTKTEPYTLTFNPPTNLTISDFTETQVTLQWQDNSTIETGFLIEQGTDGTNYTLVDSVNANITSKTLSGVFLISQTYYFRVRAKSQYNFSSYITKNVTLTFPAPTNLTITDFTETQVTLQWQDNSTFETGFEIYKSTDSI